jgi:indolepyruvate ferredoxin oxidoreductase
MIAIDGGERRGQLLGMPQMGGEGAQWIGLAPFTSERHFIQNIGDGTFHHSGSLSIRAAIAAEVNITFRLLYNGAVAMTGGQEPVGNMPIPALVKTLAAEGVKRVIITTPEPDKYRGVTLHRIAEVRHRDEFQRAQEELSAIDGVTVLLHDDRCATEKRRLRKQGKLDTPAQRVWINERVCEGCGDCGEKSTCLSVLPVGTEFGRKTRIRQSDCNQDFTCLQGDCPSFVLVTPKSSRPKTPYPSPPEHLPDPTLRVSEDVLVRMTGVGGTGVVTVSAILQMAAHMQGLQVAGLEQIGLAQKGGPVISDLRIARAPITGHLRASMHSVDVLLGFDLLGAAGPDTLPVLDPGRTVAILNSDISATASMVTDPRAPRPVLSSLIGRVQQATRGGEALVLDSESICERLFGDHMPANMLLVGAAFQHGCLPLEPETIERAIELNGAAVSVNLAAFRWGRAAVADRAALREATASHGEKPPARSPDPVVRTLLDSYKFPTPLQQLLEIRVAELAAYQDSAYARRYTDEVAKVASIELQRTGDLAMPVSASFARGLFKLMAYKDEYEVARLHLDEVERARLAVEFGAHARVEILLHPPLLRALGLKRKLRLRRSAVPLFRCLRAARKLRGSVFDPFGRTELRRTERSLIDEYRRHIMRAIERLDQHNANIVVEVADLPDIVRGYEQIKLANIEQMRARASALLGQLHLETAADEMALGQEMLDTTDEPGRRGR